MAAYVHITLLPYTFMMSKKNRVLVCNGDGKTDYFMPFCVS